MPRPPAVLPLSPPSLLGEQESGRTLVCFRDPHEPRQAVIRQDRVCFHGAIRRPPVPPTLPLRAQIVVVADHCAVTK